jgi:hypothetical protein
MMNWKRFGRKRPCQLIGTNPVFVWKDEENNEKCEPIKLVSGPRIEQVASHASSSSGNQSAATFSDGSNNPGFQDGVFSWNLRRKYNLYFPMKQCFK